MSAANNDNDGASGAAASAAAAPAPPPPNAAVAASSANDDPPTRLTVVRFLVRNLRAARGYAPADHRIDLISERHGLYDLVSAAFDVLRREKLTSDNVTSHLWSVEFAGKTYKNGWRRWDPVEDAHDRPANDDEVDEGEPRILSSLPTPLAKGQAGAFRGESANFEVVAEDVAVKRVDEKDVEVKIYNPFGCFSRDDSKVGPVEKENAVNGTEGGGGKGKEGAPLPIYPKFSKVPMTLSATLSDDWAGGDAAKQRLQRLRSAWKTYYAGENAWKRDRRTLDWIPGKPTAPAWGRDEIEILGLLINANCGFKKSWTNILQYACVDRAESAASMKWYSLKKKERYMIEHHGRGTADAGKIRLAKRVAQRSMAHFLDKGAPGKRPHPWAKAEAFLRKRGKIDDDTDEREKKRMCVMALDMMDAEDDGWTKWL